MEVFKSYPLKTTDEQNGVIETQELRGSKFWQAPHYDNPDTFGYSSVISVRLSYRKPVARIYITKKIYKQEGFMSQKEEILSDLLEESILLYKIDRELNMRARLKKL